jgi:hypothetical protein
MKVALLIICVLVSALTFGQTIKLTDHLIYPRLDSTYWEKDYDLINQNRSNIADRCQTCVFTQTDTTRGRFCFNTSFGQVQMDTTLHNFQVVSLIGKWTVINYGLFVTTDSILPNSKVIYRTQRILNEQNKDNGKVTFTNKRAKSELKNITDIPNKNKKYKIVNGKFLVMKTLSSYCGATIIGLTKDGYVILDDHTYRTLAKKEKYLVISTSIRRLILKKSITD